MQDSVMAGSSKTYSVYDRQTDRPYDIQSTMNCCATDAALNSCVNNTTPYTAYHNGMPFT